MEDWGLGIWLMFLKFTQDAFFSPIAYLLRKKGVTFHALKVNLLMISFCL